MGVVYLAQDEALLRPTAVKILSWAFLKNQGDHPEAWFLAEARSVARINHPAVVQVYAVAKHGGYCYIAMEYVEGVAGDTLVNTKGPLSPANATQAILQIAGAMGYAHNCNIIHRDIKPANVLIKPDGTAKLGDFGMALHAGSVDQGMRAPVGTPHYMAPEIWQGGSATPLTDIYALGATYFHFLTGRPPFETTDLQTLIDLHQRAAIPDPAAFAPAAPPNCARIIRKCMAKAPRDRYQSAQELGWDLRGVLRLLHGRPASDVAAELTPPVLPREVSGSYRSDSEPIEPWVTALGLARRPFAPTSPRRCPYQGEPFGGLREQLKAFVLGDPGGTLILTGARGSGCTTLARQSLGEVPDRAPAAYLDLKYGDKPLTKSRTLPQWACRALGALPSTSSGHNADLEGLIEQLSESPEPALLVLDAVPAQASLVDELVSLIRAAGSTKCMNLIVVGSVDLANQLTAAAAMDPEVIHTIAVPALNMEQTRSYLAAWLNATRGPADLPLIITPDASTLIHHRCGGNLARINNLAGNMLRMAALDGRRVLPSWYAWMAPAAEGWTPERDMDLGKPHLWPTPDVLEVLNSYRRQFGVMQRRGT
jgi:type II secretory pathway predicted ATPase ExeA